MAARLKAKVLILLITLLKIEIITALLGLIGSLEVKRIHVICLRALAMDMDQITAWKGVRACEDEASGSPPDGGGGGILRPSLAKRSGIGSRTWRARCITKPSRARRLYKVLVWREVMKVERSACTQRRWLCPEVTVPFDRVG